MLHEMLLIHSIKVADALNAATQFTEDVGALLKLTNSVR